MNRAEDIDAAKREVERDRRKAWLIEFACYVDPAQARWYRAEHLQQIADVLEQIEREELKRVIINVPPRHWKSSLASEKFPAWWLGKHPKDAVIVASYALSLAEKFSRTVRSTIQSERYQELYPSVKIKQGSNSADDWLLEGGYRTSFRAVGTGGGISGHGAKLIILDDVSDPNKILSETQTLGDWSWYKNVIRTRLEADGAIVIINNRVGVNDTTGYLLDLDRNDSADPTSDWVVVNLKALSDDGKYLWVERFGDDYYQKLQNDPYLWQIQYQQKVTTEEGTEIKAAWFEFVPRLPEGEREQCRAWDTAMTVKETEKADPDYTASIGSAMAGGWLYLVNPLKFRAEIPSVVSRIRDYKKLYPYVRMATAHSFSDNSARKLLEREGIVLEEYEEKLDIKSRCATFVVWASRGLVKCVLGEQEYERWKTDKTLPANWKQFMDEITSAFGGKHDDLLAACAGTTQMHGMVIASPTPPAVVQPQGNPFMSRAGR